MAQQFGENVAHQTNDVNKGSQAASDLSRMMIKLAVATGVPKDEAEKLAAAVVNVPENSKTKLDMPGLLESMGQVIKHHHGIDQVPTKSDTVIGIPWHDDRADERRGVPQGTRRAAGHESSGHQRAGGDEGGRPGPGPYTPRSVACRI
jgi:hypothetical protein